MPLTVEAIYEDGVLKPAQPLPLKEHEKVHITIEPETNWAERTAGMLPWTGDPEVLREHPRHRLATGPDSTVVCISAAPTATFTGSTTTLTIMRFLHTKYQSACLVEHHLGTTASLVTGLSWE